MRAIAWGVLSFARSKMSKAIVFGLIAMAMILGISLPTTSLVQAASCYSMGVYTMRTGAESKPTVLIYWGKPGQPDPYKVKLYYQSKLISTPRDDTVDTRYPQYDSGGWRGYYIAKRWILSGNLLWDEDFRWKAYYCS